MTEVIVEEQNSSSRATKETFTVAHIARTGSYLARGLPEEEKARIIEAGKFILSRAALLDFDASDLNWKLFQKPNEFAIYTAAEDLMPILLRLSQDEEERTNNSVMQLVGDIDLTKITAVLNRRITSRIEETRNYIEQETRNYNTYMDNAIARLAAIRVHNEDLTNLEAQLSNSQLDSSKIFSDTSPWMLVNTYDGCLAYVSRKNVKLLHHNDSAGIHKEYLMGQFVMIVDTSSSAFVRVYPFKNNKASAEKPHYYHPHVYIDGKLCMGNGAERINQRYIEGDYVGMGLLIWDLLQTYNPESPYQRINKFTVPYEAKTHKLILKKAVPNAFIDPEVYAKLVQFRKYDIEENVDNPRILVRATEDFFDVNACDKFAKGNIYSFRGFSNDEEQFRFRNLSSYFIDVKCLKYLEIVGLADDIRSGSYYVRDTSNNNKDKVLRRVTAPNRFDRNSITEGVECSVASSTGGSYMTNLSFETQLIKADSEELNELIAQGYTVQDYIAN